MLEKALSRWPQLKYHTKQQAAMRAITCGEYRFVNLPCGRGSGKTEISKRVLVLEAMKHQSGNDPRYFFAGPTLKHAWELAWDDLIQMIPQHMCRPAPSRNAMYLSSGARIVLVGLNDKKRADIEGFQWDGGVIDESCDIFPGLFGRIVLPALSHKRGWCLRIGAPKRQGVGAREFRKACEDADAGLIPDASTYAWESADILPADVLEQARSVMDHKDFEEQFRAKWQTAGGSVYYTFDEAVHVRQCHYSPILPIVVGADFNISPMCWVIGQKTQAGLQWFDELYLRDSRTQQTLDLLWDRWGTHSGGWEFYGDASSRNRHTSASLSDYQTIALHPRFKAAGAKVYFPASNPAVADRVASVNALFRSASGDVRQHVDPRCKQLIAELQTLAYKANSNDIDDCSQTVGHITDALGYAVHYLYPLRLDDPLGTAAVYTTRGAR